MSSISMLEPTLYQHVKRPEWGFGILAADDGLRRRFQFQDGQVRTIAYDYCHLVEEVQAPPSEVPALVAELARDLDLDRARRARGLVDASDPGVVTLDQQVERFRAAYPQGFESEAWLRDHRGDDAPRRMKRHRSPAVVEARERLSVEAFDAADVPALWTAVIEILKGTDLVRPSADITPLEGFDLDRQRRAIAALGILLFDDEANHATAFDAWVGALETSSQPSWMAATTLPALVEPHKHIPVRPVPFRRQAKWMAPRLKMSKDPNGAQYVELRAMARAIERDLHRAELPPNDLLDLYDFIVDTAKP